MALEKLANRLRIVGGFELSLVEFIGNSFDVSGEETNPDGVAFNPDGTRMFVVGDSSESVVEYSLNSGFDVSTASFSGTSFDVSGQETNPRGIAFSPDGTAMFVTGDNSDSVFGYSLSTGFELATASFSGTSFDVSAQASAPAAVTFEPNGGEMFVIGRNVESVFQYSLSTAFDLSTASFQNSFSVTSQETQPTGVAFSPDGTTMFVIGGNSDSVFEYSLNSEFDLSTASFFGTSFDVSGEATSPKDVAFNADGTAMFVLERAPDAVFEYLVGRLTLQD